MIKCEICKNLFKNTISLRSHIWQKHKISIKEYYDSYLKSCNDGICKICRKETKFNGLKNGYSKYHRECSTKDFKVREKQIEVYKKNHPKKIITYNYICKICNKPLKNIYSFNGHLRYNHPETTNKDYYDKFIKNNEKEGICSLDSCINKTNFLNIKSGYSKHCCVRHAQFNVDTREKIFNKRSINGNWVKKESKSDFILYNEEVIRLTKRNYYLYFYYINPGREKERGKHKYTIDHIYSIISGFNNKVSPKVISHPCNLRLLWYSENYKKNSKCDIEINELYNKIENFNMVNKNE